MAVRENLIRDLVARGKLLPQAIGGHGPMPAHHRQAPILPCRHLGPDVVGFRQCPTCRGSVKLKEFACAVGLGINSRAVPTQDCGPKCHGYLPVEAPPTPRPAVEVAGAVLSFDEHNLWPGTPGKRFNPSIIEDGDGYLFYVRNGWRGSEILAGRLDAEFRPVGSGRVLKLRHPDCAYGREDVRAFRLQGHPHISFIGVVGGNRPRCTNQMFARLTPDGLGVEDVFSPADYPPGRRNQRPQQWQKNWSFWDYGGTLHATYSVCPHQVLRIEGNRAELAYTTPTPAIWGPASEIRGGAAPVLVGDEWYCWFHAKSMIGGRFRYAMGVYSFENRPPFRILRITPEPIMWANPATCPKDQYCDCIFPGGSVFIPEGER